MELILISSNKLKVILNEEEATKYRLNSGSDISSASEKKHLGSLLEDIKRKSGFNTDSGSIYVELFESLHGGCEIFITREMIGLSASKSKVLKKDVRESIIAYKFNAAEHVILACKRLSERDLTYKSRLFCDDQGLFYLILTFRDGFDSDNTGLIFMNEYGIKIQNQYLREYLDEHGNLICENNAVKILSAI